MHQYPPDVRELEEMIDAHYTEKLVAKARRYHIAVSRKPLIDEKFYDEPHPVWRLGDYGEWMLTETAYADIYRQVKQERREAVQFWGNLIGMLTGLIGATAALVALQLGQ